jgi:16S rRNA (guanine527-N7)-methyltransferase
LNGNHLNGLESEFAELDEKLSSGIECLSIALQPAQRRRLLDYLALLARWNRTYNLTAVDQPVEMVARHLLDSLSILPWLSGQRVLDAGTGAGLPGVPLAVACPDRHFVLVDGNGKKIRFLRQVRRELGLDNIEPLHQRLESLPVEPVPDTITARALAPLERLVGWHRPWLDRGARLLAMKAGLEENERAGVPDAYNVEIIDLEVPGLGARRCLAIISKQ